MSFVNSIITTQGLRHQNRAIVLNAIREFGPLAHTAIGEKTGMASGTVSVITTEFLQEGVLEKVEQSPAKGRGRPRILFATRAEFSKIVVVRIFSDRVEFSLVDYSSKLLDRQTQPRDPKQNDAARFGQDLRRSLAEFVARSRLDRSAISVISVTTKGEVDAPNSTLVWSAIFGNQPLDFRALFEADWPAVVTLTNEFSFHAHNVMLKTLRADSSAVGDRQAVLSLSDSIGLAVATNKGQGEIELSSPSFSHMPHQNDGPVCRCGARGCLEAHAGFYGILRQAFDVSADQVPATFIPLEQMRRVAETARNGDRKTIFAFRQAGVALGMCLSRMFNVLGPMPLTILGAGLEFYDLFQEGLEDQMNNSFLVRMGQKQPVSLLLDEAERAFDSNVHVSLREFDRTKVATRRHLSGI